MSKLVENTPLAEHALVQKLAAHFKVPKAEIKGQPAMDQGFAEEKCPVLTYPRLEPQGFNEFVYPVTSAKLNLLEMFTWDKFEKSGVYDAFLRGEGYVGEGHDGFLLSLHLVGMVWAVYRSETGYDGLGGIFLSDPKTKYNGMVIQPIKNYLNDFYPPDDV